MTLSIPSALYDQLTTYVSRETLDKMNSYVQLVTEWNRQTSLVQINTLGDVWSRHVLDSLQIIPFVKKNIAEIEKAHSSECHIVDIGTGAGFPGMALAIAGVPNITLCESNVRKCVFLEEVARLINVNVKIVNKRVEDLTDSYDLILSRACADLALLLTLSHHVSRETHISRAIFHKGKNVNKEILDASKKWSFSYVQHPSIVESEGCILEVFDIKPK